MKFSNPETQKIFDALQQNTREIIEIPNSWLPESFHDNKRKCRTLQRLEELCDQRDGLTEHVKKKKTKGNNVELLRKQFEQKAIFAADGSCIDLDSEFDYSQNKIDEWQLNRNLQAMASSMIDAGLLDVEDLEIRND